MKSFKQSVCLCLCFKMFKSRKTFFFCKAEKTVRTLKSDFPQKEDIYFSLFSHSRNRMLCWDGQMDTTCVTWQKEERERKKKEEETEKSSALEGGRLRRRRSC